MANVLQNIGDALLVNVSPQINGTIQFNSFTESLIGLTANRTVEREFRILNNSVFWSEWKPLTNANLSAQTYYVDNTITLQVRYTRTGSDTSGVIEFQDIQIQGVRLADATPMPIVNSSIFADVFGTQFFHDVSDNLFKKLYFRGILPTYITRAENVEESEDSDFIDLFYSVARFFAMMIAFGKRFEDFKDDFNLMREYVREYGIYFDENTITLNELQYLASHYYDEIRRRGTAMIFNHKGDTLPGGEVAEIDGELVRLLRNKRENEALYENIQLDKIGWCLGQCSPMYRGTCASVALNKTKEETQDFQSLDDFFTTNQSMLSIQPDGDRKVLRINPISNSVWAGLGRNDNANVSENLYVADSGMDYEITFAIKVTQRTSNSKIMFGVEGFDVNKRKLLDAFTFPNGYTTDENFFNVSLTHFKLNEWYYVRGIVHAYSSERYPQSKTNIGIGTNFYFNNKFLTYILPRILVSGSSTSVELWDYKIRPLVRGTNILPKIGTGIDDSHSLGFIESSRILYAYLRNKNNNYSEQQITSIIERYLLPYNSTTMLMFIR